MNPKVDAYIAKSEKWGSQLAKLRELFLSTEMEETVKWGAPVYTVNGKNVAGLASFKNHYGMWFFNGVFLKDEHKMLVNAQETTKGLRQIRFEEGDEIPMDIIHEYVLEAIENEKSGLKIKPKRTADYKMPDQLKSELDASSDLLDAFMGLSKGKQKEYANYISEAKQEKTKVSRLEKIKPMILDGKGLHDKYRDC
jgi:uncharacterized protein YdeI (YjbR/CyaY-like superfamily)